MAGAKKYRIRWLKLALILIFGYFVYIWYGQYAHLSAIRRETEAVRQHVEELEQANRALEEEKRLLNTNAYIEKLAREQLGLVKPGEMPLVAVPRQQP